MRLDALTPSLILFYPSTLALLLTRAWNPRFFSVLMNVCAYIIVDRTPVSLAAVNFLLLLYIKGTRRLTQLTEGSTTHLSWLNSIS
jgi:hypothetical protein